MKLRTIVMIAFITATAIACAQTGDWGAAKAQAATAIDSGDCAGAWNLVWPWARKGNIEARAILATGVVAAGLIPPGGHGDAISQFRHSVILAVHGAADGDRATTVFLRALIRDNLISDMGGDRLKRCLDADTPPRTCVAGAINDGFVPDFEDYSREIDAYTSTPDAPAASCRLGEGALEQPLPVQQVQ
ncbi:MAG: hypothetical protein GXP19_00275 [Gammaproteobacteria bacterium]|nr:hypothetical protein [Gammaproteobacteria bacterium]